MSFAQPRQRLQSAVFDRLGEDALWNDATAPIRVRFASQEEVARFGDGGGVIVSSMALKVRLADVAQPVIGDVAELTESGRKVRVSADPMMDRNGRWVCPVSEL